MSALLSISSISGLNKNDCFSCKGAFLYLTISYVFFSKTSLPSLTWHSAVPLSACVQGDHALYELLNTRLTQPSVIWLIWVRPQFTCFLQYKTQWWSVFADLCGLQPQPETYYCSCCDLCARPYCITSLVMAMILLPVGERLTHKKYTIGPILIIYTAMALPLIAHLTGCSTRFSSMPFPIPLSL